MGAARTRRPLRAALAMCAWLGATALAIAAPTASDHVCAVDEGLLGDKASCSSGRVRMCATNASFAGCVCAPGMSASAAAASCSFDSGAPSPVACTVPNATIADALDAALELGQLEVPALPTTVRAGATDVVADLDGKASGLSSDDLVKLAAAHESIEGAAAYDASDAPKTKLTALLARRDASLGRAIDVRHVLVAKFPDDARVMTERVALARALLRRAAYAGVGSAVAVDRAEALKVLAVVVEKSPGTTAARDAAFILGEHASRDKSWVKVLLLFTEVVTSASAKLDPGDHAYLAAAYARLAEARLATADLIDAKVALAAAIDAGLTCSPRAECVSASAGARSALAATWAATGAAARTMVPILTRGTMPKQERVRPLVRLSEIYAAATGAGCPAAAEEARAYAQVLK